MTLNLDNSRFMDIIRLDHQNDKGDTIMVARLFFPAFAKHHSPGYHRYLADVVDFGTKIADPAFRAKATIRHMEDFSTMCSGNATQQWAKSVKTGVALSKAMDAGIKAFWESWFTGIADAQKRFNQVFEEARKSSLLVYGRSKDGHVLSVRFDNRFLTDRALGQIREDRRANS